VILECCVCSKATTFDQLETWTKTTQVMERWPFRVRVRYYNWLRANEGSKAGRYEDPQTGILVTPLCSKHTKQVVEEAGLLVSWNGLDALLPLFPENPREHGLYGPTFHVGPYMLKTRIYSKSWSVCVQGLPMVIVKLPRTYEAAYDWHDRVWESVKGGGPASEEEWRLIRGLVQKNGAMNKAAKERIWTACEHRGTNPVELEYEFRPWMRKVDAALTRISAEK
jgi:hypothetical protein